MYDVRDRGSNRPIKLAAIDELPVFRIHLFELGLLTLSQLPGKDQMQYLGHGFLWNPERAKQVLAVERDSAVISRSRGPGDLGGVTTLHAVGRKEEQDITVTRLFGPDTCSFCSAALSYQRSASA